MKRPLEPVSEDDDSDIEVEVQRGGCDSGELKHASWPGAEKRAPEGAAVEQLEPVEGHQLALSAIRAALRRNVGRNAATAGLEAG